MTKEIDKLKQILVDGDYIEEKVFDEAVKVSEKEKKDVVEYLIDNHHLSYDLVGQAKAELYKVPYYDLNSRKPVKDLILKLPEKVAKKYCLVLVEENDKEIKVVTNQPDDDNFLKEVKKIFPNKEIAINFSLKKDIENIHLEYQKPLNTRIDKLIKSTPDYSPLVIDEIFEDALIYKSSDIHIEPREREVNLRMRIDGVLREMATINKDTYETLLNRIKVLSNLRTDIHQQMQDGSIRYSLKEKIIELRISITPTIYGEKVVARVLSSYVKELSLSELGLNEKDRKIFEDVSKKPFGMVINVGPTGSGKTTTLYSIIKDLNNSGVNITTIEDPVEYRVDGVNQIQVDVGRDITFSKGLRSIVRQDPDIILVGEIRDNETAEIAVNAALTGHLLFSTFHANDAATAIPRLLDMGVEPFLLSSTIELIIAQRLVRKICDECKYSYEEKVSKLNTLVPNYNFNGEKKITLFKGKGCNNCSGTGFNGRLAIFEYIKMSSELKDIITKNPTSQDIWRLAVDTGSKSLFDDGIEKVTGGLTTLEELLRVAKPIEYELEEEK